MGFSAGSGCSVRRPASSFREVRTRYVWYAELILAAEVAFLLVGERQLPVAPHGVAVVVWAEEPDAVVALDVSERPLGAVEIRRPPMMNRDTYRGD